MQLAGSSPLLRAVGLPVDHHPTGTADSLSAVVLEGDRLPVVEREAIVDDIEHLEERSVRTDAGSEVLLESSRTVRPVLTPDAKCYIHYL